MSRKHTIQQDRRNGNYFVWLQRNGGKIYFNLLANKRKTGERLREIEQNLASGKIAIGQVGTSQVTQNDGIKDVRIEELAVRHLEWIKAKRSDGLFRVRQHYILQFLEFVGEAMVSDITRSKLDEFHIFSMREHSRSPNGGNEALSNIKAMMRWGVEQEICELSFKQFPKLCRVPPETKRISYEDMAKLLAEADDDFRDMLRFGLLTGLRPKELMELKHANCLTDGNGDPYISIHRHKTSKSARTPRPRTVPLCSDAHAIILNQTAAHPKSDLIFLNGIGTPYTRYALKTRLGRLSRKAKTSRAFTPYALRHTFASMESDAGVETTSLARLMGHTTTRTLERYVSNTFESHRKAVTALQDRIRSVVEQAAGDKTETKTTTETATEITQAKRTCDLKVTSPLSLSV